MGRPRRATRIIAVLSAAFVATLGMAVAPAEAGPAVVSAAVRMVSAAPTPDLPDGVRRPLTSSMTAGPARASRVPAAATGQPAWLARLNTLRAWAGVAPVTEDPVLSAADAAHVAYMNLNPDEHGHYETPGKPGYTANGHTAASHSNLVWGASDPVEAIDMWAAAPYHAAGMLSPGITKVGFAMAGTSAALDVLGTFQTLPATNAPPLVWPGGSAVDLYEYSGNETPDPVANCGAEPATGWGLPIIVGLGNYDSGNGWARTDITAVDLRVNGVPVATCITADNQQSFVIPRGRLKQKARYTGTVTTNRGVATIDFTTTQQLTDINTSTGRVSAYWAAGWYGAYHSAYYNGTALVTYRPGATWKFWATGGQVLDLYGTAFTHGAKMMVAIDGVDYNSFDTYRPTDVDCYRQLVGRIWIPGGSHEITIRMLASGPGRDTLSLDSYGFE